MVSIGQVNVLTLAVVIVAVVAVGIVAATISSVVVYEQGDEPGELNVHGEQIGDEFDINVSGEQGDIDDLEGGAIFDLVYCVRWLTQPSAVMGILAGLLGLLYLVQWRFNLATALLTGTFLIPVVMLAYFFFTNCPSRVGETNDGLFGDFNAIEASGEGFAAIPAIPPALAALVLGGFMLVAIVVLFSLTGQDETLQESELSFEPEPEAADFARAAQRARERIEGSNMPVDNAVYQAWLEMTGLLSMEHPDSAAPYEFALEAIDVGLAEDDVNELTALFTDVRYGRKDASTREDRALRVLRNIEETYRSSVDVPEEDDDE